MSLGLYCCRYVGITRCNSYILVWFGLLPMQLSMSCIVVLTAAISIPVEPSSRQLYLHECLQEVSAMKELQ
jgi:hypothetical protein